MKSINHTIINESFGKLIEWRGKTFQSVSYDTCLLLSALDHRDILDIVRRSIHGRYNLYYLNITAYE